MKYSKSLLNLALTALLIGCGGGSSEPSQNSNQPTSGNEQPKDSETPETPETPNNGPSIETPQANEDRFPTRENLNKSEWLFVEELSDEFNDATIALTKWDNDLNDWGPWSWEPDNTSIDAEGHLHLTISYEEHTADRTITLDGNRQTLSNDMFYKSGIIRSKQTITYGYFEARIKGNPTFPGASPAFWLYSNANDRNAAGMFPTEAEQPYYSEIDIVELQQREWSDITGTAKWDDEKVMDMNLHAVVRGPNGEQIQVRPHNSFSDLAQNKLLVDFDPREDFHIYAAEVTPETITWFLDGKQVFQKTNKYWHLPMRVTLSLGLRSPHVTYDCTGEYAGLPRCPVRAEKTGEGYPNDMEVDWVRVYHKVE
ncbi:glycoside hydrolase family 16 [Saccharobesus litoralis]|uniref:Glycoside hydrolase family 16 n=1 Tax=Saccharobesus litoralis TaxID=2172099 RepID=A0A2S0VLK9_9ALTE|nr:family 16 glycosylhydrolase [Saccharobesus litoralis]AWB65000.1 glycoside hydrolase family 16 [Saccharobesus litoralis]